MSRTPCPLVALKNRGMAVCFQSRNPCRNISTRSKSKRLKILSCPSGRRVRSPIHRELVWVQIFWMTFLLAINEDSAFGFWTFSLLVDWKVSPETSSPHPCFRSKVGKLEPWEQVFGMTSQSVNICLEWWEKSFLLIARKVISRTCTHTSPSWLGLSTPALDDKNLWRTLHQWVRKKGPSLRPYRKLDP